MEVMEQLLETGIIGYIQYGMYYIVREVIDLAASSEDWQEVTSHPPVDALSWIVIAGLIAGALLMRI